MATTALACEPPVCPISAAGGKSQHKLINQCCAKLAFKVKSSNNSNYCVKPVFGFVKVGEQVNMEITRSNGKPKADKLVILFAEVPDDMTDAGAAFQPGFQSPLSGEVVVKLSAARIEAGNRYSMSSPSNKLQFVRFVRSFAVNSCNKSSI